MAYELQWNIEGDVWCATEWKYLDDKGAWWIIFIELVNILCKPSRNFVDCLSGGSVKQKNKHYLLVYAAKGRNQPQNGNYYV